MTRQLLLFDRPRRFIAGTVGQPGERAFYLQVADERRVVSLGLEKRQVAMLADRMHQLLEEVRGAADSDPAPAPADQDGLEMPIEERFRVGAMGLAWDGDEGMVVLEAQAPAEEGQDPAATLLSDEDRDGPDAVRVRMDPQTARAFVTRARRLVAAGRPPCPLCTLPLDPRGHLCPRLNGYRRALPGG
ncbi:MAG: DUF3090 family protein [Frankiaceae bacterium]|jgi:uncharacterized repeat protein (TIGR03847 family)|nr:DUF3090 family protein [Frankiaceae bacterium]